MPSGSDEHKSVQNLSPCVNDYIQPAAETLSDKERRRTAIDRARIIEKGHNQKLYIKPAPPPFITATGHLNQGYKRVRKETQSRFSAFFLFSAPVEPAAVAERLTAFVVLGGAGPIPAPPPTFALAVPSGEGDVICSLLSLSFDKEDMDVGSVLAGDD
jgi:hypothetical protein